MGSGSSNDSNDSAKRRRDANAAPPNVNAGNYNDNDDDDFTRSTGRSKKRTVERKDKDGDPYPSKDPGYDNNTDNDDLCPAVHDLDFDDLDYVYDDVESKGNCPEVGVNLNGVVRVLPSWSRT
ncbi:hypothetical protein F3Y22_tig00006888pilonHSYRG00017 [Hibiscus syriacus]|uniref:Uncharacterized protein n=1 Tax=Hibiscus syriacus TaxID=106335 RepID=A0A6A3CGF3_HIBSY|nr:hypothetical protein F3Y22_tig00006888pilonHSYRG00017 [Hibiscus syriacus]